MPRRQTVLLLALALLSALWQPLCLCRSVSASRSASTGKGCCSEQEAPRPDDPCEPHDGACDCGTKLTLALAEFDGTGSSVTFAFALELPSFLPPPPMARERVHAAVPCGRPPASPGSAGRLPLRI
jgi:hypothetical protein